MADENKFWTSKVTYLKGVTGEGIVSAQDQINNGKDKFVVATQIFPVDTTKHIFDCFIYWKDKHGHIKGL